jgi:hypothetical protein
MQNRYDILVIITDDEINRKFKDIWIRNLKDTNFNLWFVYGRGKGHNEHSEGKEKGIRVVKGDSYIDLYANVPETFENIIYKTLVCLDYVKNVTSSDFIIRSNMSTLINPEKLEKFLTTLPKSNVFGGPFIGNNTEHLLISGTLMIMSRDITDYIVNTSFVNNHNEDVIINRLLPDTYTTFNVSRLDFVDKVIYHKSFKDNKNIFCYRFKTQNRHKDAVLMKLIMDNFDNIYSIKELNLSHSIEELPLYQHLYNTPHVHRRNKR